MVAKSSAELKQMLRQKDTVRVIPSHIRNKEKRLEVVKRLRSLKKKQRKIRRKEREEKDLAMGITAENKIVKEDQTRTIENMRVHDETIVEAGDKEILADEEMDEFSKYFKGESKPKICITTCRRPTPRMLDLIRELLMVFPQSVYFERRDFEIKVIVEEANENGYTDIMVLNEDKISIHSLMHIHLPCGPTALFRLSSVKLNSEIEGHGRMSPHNPEVILNNFKTRLGRRVGRMLASLFYQKPDFDGRRVATFHNQRDFIFFRQHRYVFEDGEAMQKMPNGKYKKVKKTIARLQELGPQFTLKLQSLQHGTFDSMHGEYEFKLTPAMQVDRKKFFI